MIYEDTGGDRTGFALHGSANDDLLEFQAGSRNMSPITGGQTLDGFLNGEAGHDILVGSADNSGNYTDILSGGAGIDYLFGDNGPDKLYGGEDNDFVDAGDRADPIVEGNNGDDVVVAGGHADVSVDGNAGHDFICGDAANNVPNNVRTFTPGPTFLTGQTEDPSTWYGNGVSSPLGCNTGTGQNDTIRGGAGDDIIYSGAGDDTVTGGTGTDMIYLGEGADQACDVAQDGDELNGENGNDGLWATGNSLTFSALFDGGGQVGDECSASVSGLVSTNCTQISQYFCP